MCGNSVADYSTISGNRVITEDSPRSGRPSNTIVYISEVSDIVLINEKHIRKLHTRPECLSLLLEVHHLSEEQKAVRSQNKHRRIVSKFPNRKRVVSEKYCNETDYDLCL